MSYLSGDCPDRLIERLRNKNKDKTKTQMTQSFNQYSENETKIWRQNVLNQFNRVSSSCLRSHFVISLTSHLGALEWSPRSPDLAI